MLSSDRAKTILLSAITATLLSGFLLFLENVPESEAIWPFTMSGNRSSVSSATPAAASAPVPSPPRFTSEEQAVITVVEKSEPAVVSVVISKDVPVLERYYEQSPLPSDPFFDQFFSPFELQIPRFRQKGTERQDVGGGTAFFVSADGMLLTNKHVVDDPDAAYTAILNDGRKLPAKVLARDPGNDIALLKVETGNFPFLTISHQEPVLGQTVIAIGNALGEFRNTVSRGVVSGLRRSITAGSPTGFTEQLSRIMQTDAAINQGNSGGPLLNTAGEVMGMNTAIAGGAQNIAFAIPAEDIIRVLESYRKHGRLVRPYIGVRYIPVTKDLQKKNNLKVDYGVLISRGETASDLAVIPDSPADKAGILENDIILEADSVKITDENPLGPMVLRKLPGDAMTLKILRKGKNLTLKVTLQEWKGN